MKLNGAIRCRSGDDHLNFKLSPDVGLILLSAADLSVIDLITYGPQHTDVAQGRSPSGGDLLTAFAHPTPGAANPGPGGGVTSVTNVTRTVLTLIAVTNTWRYNNSGIDLGDTWRQLNYDDGGWLAGQGLLGFETTPDVYPYPFLTAIPPPNQANGHPTVYYRTHFQWTEGLVDFGLVATNYLDDGAVFYLNGTEVGRLRVAANPVLYASPAVSQPSEGQAEVLNFSTNRLVKGDNVLEVEVHQANATSTDDVFGMSLSAVHSVTNIVTSEKFSAPVVLNELLAAHAAVVDPSLAVADWVELFNTSTNAYDLSDLSLSDDPDQPRRWVFPPGSTIPPLGYRVIYCDSRVAASSTNTGFNLDGDGGSLYLFDRANNGGALVDALTYGLQASDFSLGRIPNGTGAWTLNPPTPGAGNAAAGLGAIAGLKVNEWMADPVSGSDWFELYNSGSQPVALGGLFLTDNLTDKTQSPIRPLSFIGPGAFVQFLADANPSAGSRHVNFSLKKGGEAVGLYSPVGTLIDGVTFGGQTTGVSQGRFPDGGTTIVGFLATPSPEERDRKSVV